MPDSMRKDGRDRDEAAARAEAAERLEVKVAPHDAARRLGDAICLRYSVAFELLRDR